jgi:hypothetical protein
MKKIYTILFALIVSSALFGQTFLENNSAINNDNNNLNIVTEKKNSSELALELDKIKVFPNPVADELVVNISNVNINIPKIEVFDITGRLIESIVIKDKDIINVDFTGQRKGLYLLSFYNQVGEVILISKIQKI